MAAHKKKADPVPSSFADTLLFIARRYSLFTVFDDFLTMAIAACTQNPKLRASFYESEYLETIAKYKDSELRHEFPKAFALLIAEMESRVSSAQGNDVLGEFFETHISNGRNGQFFTPFPICQLMASITSATPKENGEPVRILDPACGSGRILLAARSIGNEPKEYYGIDIDRTCVKMAALNLFLNGMWNSEIMCANALNPDDFVIAYRISFMPFGIFKIEDKEKSAIWHLHRQSLEREQGDRDFTKASKEQGSQLKLF